VTSQSPPTRTLPPRPDLEQLKRQAKELLESFATGKAAAVAEVTAHYHDADPATFELHDAQLVIARAYGFESLAKAQGICRRCHSKTTDRRRALAQRG
jgi:hypothetical protein